MKRTREETYYRIAYEYKGSEEYIDIPVSNGDNILEQALSAIRESNPKVRLVDMTSIEVVSSCYACRNDFPGQDEHMTVGGCLYKSSLSSKSQSPPSSVAL